MEGSRYPKRERKPNLVYLPEEPKEIIRKEKKSSNNEKKQKNRNRAADGSKENKWQGYVAVIKKAVNYLLRDMQTLEVKFEGKTAPVRGKNTLWELERLQCEKKIFTAKQAIVSTLQAIVNENTEHKRWPQLLSDGPNQKDAGEEEEEEDDSMIDVDDIFCSVCNQEETEQNDILFCDRTGCGRAYHQLCLDPPLDVANIDPDHDWFCWQCECLDDCLDIISERLEVEYWDWKEVFPEVRQSLEGGGGGGENGEGGEGGNTILTAVLPDDEEDDDYDPSDEEEGEENGYAEQSDNDAEENEDGNGEVGEHHNAAEEEQNQDMLDVDEEGEDDEEDEFDEEDDEDDDDIDEDEVQGLLEDANISYHALQQLDEEEDVPITKRLRQRNQKKETIEVKLTGKNDIGKFVARVRRGVFQVGKIIEFLPPVTSSGNSSSAAATDDDFSAEEIQNSQWKVHFSKKFLQNPEEDDNDEDEGTETNDGEGAVIQSKEHAETNERIEGTINDPIVLDDEQHHLFSTNNNNTNNNNRRRRRYRDDEETLIFTADQVRAGLLMHHDYHERLQAIHASSNSSAFASQRAMQELVDSTGALDEGNVLAHKRERKAIDYVQLSLQLFGSLQSDDDEEDEDVIADEDDSRSKDKKRNEKKRQQSSTRKRSRHDEDDEDDDQAERGNYVDLTEEIDEVLDAEWDEEEKKKNKKKSKRKTKSTPRKRPKQETKPRLTRKRKKEDDSDEEGEENEKDDDVGNEVSDEDLVEVRKTRSRRANRQNHNDDSPSKRPTRQSSQKAESKIKQIIIDADLNNEEKQSLQDEQQSTLTSEDNEDDNNTKNETSEQKEEEVEEEEGVVN